MGTKIFTEISGSEITNRKIIEEFDIKGKFERIISQLLPADGEVSLPIENYGDINKIIINSTNCILRVTTTGDVDHLIPIAGFFMWTLSKDYVDTITSLNIYTTSVTAVDISITICGV
jgi:hypothetical protein